MEDQKKRSTFLYNNVWGINQVAPLKYLTTISSFTLGGSNKSTKGNPLKRGEVLECSILSCPGYTIDIFGSLNGTLALKGYMNTKLVCQLMPHIKNSLPLMFPLDKPQCLLNKKNIDNKEAPFTLYVYFLALFSPPQLNKKKKAIYVFDMAPKYYKILYFFI